MQRNEILMAIIEGKQIQRQDSRWKDAPWEDMVIGTGGNVVIRISTDYYNYRIKPEVETITYRVALFNDTEGSIWLDAVHQKYCDDTQKHQDFVRWLTDEQTAEI